MPIIAAGVAPLLGCASGANARASSRPANTNDPPARSAPALESLAASIEPLRRHFNEDEGTLRFIALLSPT